MTVIYLDSVFVLNALTDYLLLLATARLAGIPLHRLRYLLAALLGGMYAVTVFLPECGFLGEAPSKIAGGVLLALVSFGNEHFFLRLTLLFFAVSCALAGCVMAVGLLAGVHIPSAKGVLYINVNGWVLLVATTAAYLLLNVIFRTAASAGMQGLRLPVRIYLNGRKTEGSALWDSGNHLRGLNGEPILIVTPNALRSLLPHELLEAAQAEDPADAALLLRRLSPELQPLLLPYSAVGTQSGLLVAIRADRVEIGGRLYNGLYLARSPDDLGAGYMALWGGEAGKSANKKSIGNQEKLRTPERD